MSAPERFPEGRLLTVTITEARQPGGRTWWHWVLLDDDETELAMSSVTYGSETAAADGARDIFGGWLGSVIGIDLKRTDGTRERLR